MKTAGWRPSRRGHLSEALIQAAAEDRGAVTAWSADQRAHLLGCGQCRELLARHEYVSLGLRGEWAEREISGIFVPAYRPPISRWRLVAAVCGAVALLAVVSTTVWIWRFAPEVPSPAAPPMTYQGFPVYEVNPAAKGLDIHVCLQAIQDYITAQPDWGEDFSVNGRLYENFTGNPEGHLVAIRARAPADCQFYVRIVPMSSTEGRALQAQISADMPSLIAAGIPVNTLGFDPVRDKVQVGLYPLTPEAKAAIERRYSADKVDVIEQESLPPT
jgi:hypothetical protein